MATEQFGESQGRKVSDFAKGVRHQHIRSRMLERYLADLDDLMREDLWNEALPLALALPHLCAALADPAFSSSRERFVAWCELWLYPTFTQSQKEVPTAHELYAFAHERAGFGELEATAGVPMEFLKRLRLRRLARPSSMLRRAMPADTLDESEVSTHRACVYIMQAVYRWYDEWAVFDATVQTNLARLAVLR